MPPLTRREFTALIAAAAPFARAETVACATPIRAQDVVERIRKHVGVEWRSDSADAITVGDPSTVLTGIATTSMATMDVLQRAVNAGANFVVTAQPTFYARVDSPAGPPKFTDDPIVRRKNQFIAGNRLVIFRLSDHWRQRQPNPFAQGLASALGWTKRQSAADPLRYDIPARSLESIANDVARALRSRGGIRVVGDPRLRAGRIGLLPGTTPIRAALDMLPNVDVIVAGEVREWESVEYVRDKIFAGEKKGLVLVGRVVADEPGMAACAAWLKSFVAEVSVRHIGAGDPYWRPAR
jgi:putative NIF3 family GTP cyclohydrolase 1 type 2